MLPPNSGPQPPSMIVPNNAPVYSAYTTTLIGYGPISFGTISDAPSGHPNYGKPFHCIQQIPGIPPFFMAHNPHFGR